MKKKAKKKDRLEATKDQIALVRARFEAIAARVNSSFWREFPHVKEALDALPELGPARRCAPEWRDLLEHAFLDAGLPKSEARRLRT